MRRNEVLVRMGALGPESPVGITSEREDRAKELPLGLPKGVGKLTQKKQPFFVRYMIQQVLENANGQFDTLGRSVKARKRTLFEGGLQITTTVDPQWQEFAQQAANQPYRVAMPSNGKAHPDTSIVTVDTNSGAIRTMLSGKNFMEDELALATDPHPTGSAFKPFVLAAAFEQGVPPDADLLERVAVLQPPVGRRRQLRRERRGQRQRQGRPVDRHRGLDQRRVRPAHPRHRPRDRAAGRRRRWASRPTFPRWPRSRPVRPRCRRSTWRWASRRSPTAGVHCTPYTVQTIERDGEHALRARGRLRARAAPRHRPPHLGHAASACRRAAPRRAPSTAGARGRSPARPAPPTSTRRCGSAATPASSPPRCGSGPTATRTRSARCSAARWPRRSGATTWRGP